MKRVICVLLALVMLLPGGLFSRPEQVYAGGLLKLATAKSVAVARSQKIEGLDLQIATKRAARDSAVRALREKQHNMSTTRWSPLLDFKFPTEPSEAESFEFQYKPTQLEYQIKEIRHKITDETLNEYEKVSNIYIGIIQSRQELDFIEKRIKNLDKELKKARARQEIGEVSEDVVNKMEDRLKNLKSKLTEQETKFQRNKEKLGKEMGGVDLTTGYIFEDAFATADMKRGNIEYLQTYAIERDQNVYEAQQNADLALLSLQVNFNLYKQHYGRFIGTISSYVQQAMDGSDVNEKAFTKDYDKFLKEIDSPWEGSKKILFISFPKAWMKGDSDGMNWIEDDPKVLFTNTLEYVSARKELENAKDELRDTIEEGYDTYISTRRAYVEADGNMKELQSKLIADEVRNLMGELENEEFDAEKEEYEQAESATNDALGAYSQNLYSYDRTTCGGVSKFMEFNTEKSTDQEELDKKLNSLEGVTKVGAHYSIRTIISNSEFIVTIDVPPMDDREFLDDAETEENPDYFKYNITDFELRINGKTIGEKTPKDGSIRHLKLDKDNADEVKIRLYDGNTIIDDVVIDPTVPWGPLDITEYVVPEESDGVLGTYKVEDDLTTDMIRIVFDFDQEAIRKQMGQNKEAAFYNLSADRTLYLFSDHMVAVDQPFNYLSFIRGDLGQLTLRLFDQDGTFLGGARFDSVNQKLIKDADVMQADMQNVALQELATKNKVDALTAELNKAKDSLNEARAKGDTTEEEYYTRRIAELEEQINNAGDNLSEEDLEKVRTEQADELQQLTEQKAADAEKSDEEKAKEAEDELKRQSILRTAAEESVGKKKWNEAMTDLRNQRDAWAYKETELQMEFDRLSGELGASSDEARAVLAELQAAKRKKRSLEDEIKTHSAFDRNEFPVSEEEIQEELALHPEDVYAIAGDRLKSLDDFAGPAYESAKAEAENYGIELSTDNVRFMMNYTEELKMCKAIEKQMAVMQKDKENLEKQIEDIKNLPDDDPRKSAQSAMLGQLEKVKESYEKQLGILKERESQLNPAKALLRKQVSDEIKDERQTLQGLEARRDKTKKVYDQAVAELRDLQNKIMAAEADLNKYGKEQAAQEQSAKILRQMEQQMRNRVNELQAELDDMNFFEEIGNAFRSLWGDSHEDRIAAARSAANSYANTASSAERKSREIKEKLIPETKKRIQEGQEAMPAARKKKDDAEVPYQAAEEEVQEQNQRIDKLKDRLKSI